MYCVVPCSAMKAVAMYGNVLYVVRIIQRSQSPKIDLCLCTVTAKYATHGSGMTAKYEAWWSLKYSRQSASDPLMYKILWWTDWWSWSKETHSLAPAFAELSGFQSQLGVLRWFFYLGRCENPACPASFLALEVAVESVMQSIHLRSVLPVLPLSLLPDVAEKAAKMNKTKKPKEPKGHGIERFWGGQDCI